MNAQLIHNSILKSRLIDPIGEIKLEGIRFFEMDVLYLFLKLLLQFLLQDILLPFRRKVREKERESRKEGKPISRILYLSPPRLTRFQSKILLQLVPRVPRFNLNRREIRGTKNSRFNFLLNPSTAAY